MYYSLFQDIDQLFNAPSSSLTHGYIDGGYIGPSKSDLTGNEFSIKQIVAGIDKNRIKVSCHNRNLKVYVDYGEKTQKLINSYKFYQDIDSKKIKAKLSDGILSLTVPRKEKSDAVEISIS